jgi:hypothetical protein
MKPIEFTDQDGKKKMSVFIENIIYFMPYDYASPHKGTVIYFESKQLHVREAYEVVLAKFNEA